MITFTVKGKEGVYNLVDSDTRYVFGKLVNSEGKTGRGRPSKFANELVTTSEPIPETKVEAEKEVEVTADKPEETQLELVLENDRTNRDTDDFLPLD